MKIVKIALGTLAALWSLGILLKLLRRMPLILQSQMAPSYLLGAFAGLLITGVIAYACFKSAFADNQNPKLPQ